MGEGGGGFHKRVEKKWDGVFVNSRISTIKRNAFENGFESETDVLSRKTRYTEKKPSGSDRMRDLEFVEAAFPMKIYTEPLG